MNPPRTRERREEGTGPHIRTQLNYRRFLISRKESRRYSSDWLRAAAGSLKIEAIYEHNVKSNTMQTLISRARDISPRADQCNISRKRVCLRSSFSLSLSFLVPSLGSPTVARIFVHITHYVVTKLRDLSSNRQRPVGVVEARAKILQSFIALMEISFEERKGEVTFFPVPPIATCGMRLDL